MRPMRAGAIQPAQLPMKFCSPVHFPAVDGPAKVCVIDHRLEVPMPSPMQTRNRMDMAMRWLAMSPTSSRLEATSKPVPVKVLRTRVGVPPAAIHRSEIQPDTNAESANTKKAEPITMDMSCTEK